MKLSFPTSAWHKEQMVLGLSKLEAQILIADLISQIGDMPMPSNHEYLAICDADSSKDICVCIKIQEDSK